LTLHNRKHSSPHLLTSDKYLSTTLSTFFTKVITHVIAQNLHIPPRV